MAPGCLGRQGAWGAREPGAEGSLSREVGAPGSLGRKGAWGGRDPQWAGREAATGAGRGLGRKGVWGGREPGAGGSLGRKGAWGGREPGAGGSLGREGAWGGREPVVEGSLGREGVWGASSMRGGPSVHTLTHQPPLAPSRYDISQPAGRHLPYTPIIRQGGRFLSMFSYETENMTTSGPVPDNLRRN